MKFLRSATLMLALALGLVAAGCADEVGLIDRTQPNAIKKAHFRGVWYSLNVITDIPVSAGFGFVGQTNFGGEDGGKVIFDFHEKEVFVYPFTEKVLGGDAKWNTKKVRNYWDEGKFDEFVEVVVGNPIAIFPVEHFDIQRAYSKQTGAEGNEIVENKDKPWFQRKHVRINWLGNTLVNVMFPQGSMKYSPVDYYVPETELNDPNKFFLDPENGYFHYTRRMFGQPMSTGACSTYSLAPGDCAGAAFDVRMSFKRANPKRINDFEIRPYHNSDAQDKFGFFLADRYTFDEEYGLTYAGHDYKAARWNLWQRSKEFTPVAGKDGKPLQCRTNRDCAAPAVCDQADWFAPGVCATGKRLEYSQRGLRPIVYHVSQDHPVNHLAAVYHTADGWSDVFKETVSWLYFWEQKWGEDGIKGFSDGQSRFGQRFCATHADCSGHAAAQVAVEANGVKSNRVVIAAGKPGAADAIVVDDEPTSRPKLSGDSYLVFVHASQGVGKAKLTTGETVSIEAEYKKGVIAGKDQAVVVPAAEFGGTAGKAVELKVTAGDKTATLPNVKVKGNEIYVVVYFGGDRLVVLRSSVNKTGLRAVNALNSKEIDGPAGKVSAGDDYELGVNGSRLSAGLPYGTASDFLFSTGDTAHVAFVRQGSRGDVSCMSVQGVGTCVGWNQKLTPADLDKRKQIKAGLRDAFVVCENVFRPRAECKADEIGNHAALNDCRYWTKDEQGKDYNPCADVKDGGEVASADQGKLIGDIRYNFMYWVPNIHASSPLGYGPSAADPDTGEIIWSTANIYGASMVTYAQYAKDLVDLLNGDLKLSDIASGKYIKQYLQAQSQSGKDKSLFGAAQDDVKLTPEEEIAAAKERATVHMADKALALLGEKPGAIDQKAIHDMQNRHTFAKFAREQLPTFDMSAVFARLDQIKGTSVERAMINDEVALVLSEGNVQPGEALSPEMLGKISPTGWATPRRELDEKKRMTLLGINSIQLAEFQDPGLLGLAQRLKCQPGQSPSDVYDGDVIGKNVCYKGDALRTALSVAIFKGVLEHEVGHTVGLRHNFSASTDLLNYFDPYFQIREKEPVLCADLKTAAGVIGKDEFCEKDIAAESCVLLSCTTDSDCPGGLACATGKCLDADSLPVGTCHAAKAMKTPCTAETTGQACGGDGVCVEGFCAEKVGCATAKSCGDGEQCTDGFCVSAATGLPRSTLLVDQVKGEVLKYVPRARPTENEVKSRRTEYQYSSVMDYGQKVNSDIHGLGKYDYAAIKYGYGELLEVYSDPSYLVDAVKAYAKNVGSSFEQVSWRLGTNDWRYGGNVTPSFEVVNEFMPPEYNAKRHSVPATLVELEDRTLYKYGRNEVDRTFFEVPYKYCSDEFRGNLGCYYFDTGVSPEEIVYHAGEALEEYYVFDAFKRERMWFGRGGSPLAYMARIQDRWLRPLGDAGRYYAVYNNIYRVFPWFTQWENSEFGLRSLRRASEDSFDRLAALITAPAPGSYAFDKTANMYTNVSYDEGKGELDIPLGVGKYPWTSFATNKGYYYYDHPQWIGGYWDKVAAIATLTNSTASFLSDFVGEQLPLFRGTAIGFNTIYPDKLAQLLGGLAAADVQAISGTVDPASGKYRPLSFFKPGNASGDRVPPSILNNSLRLLAAWQAMANLPAGFDPTFTDSMAVWLKGSGTQYKFGEGTVGGKPVEVEFVEFHDPFGKKTYVAPRPKYAVNQYSPTFRMLERLNTMKTGCADGSVCGGTDGANTCANGAACAAGTWFTKATGADKDAITVAMKKELEVVDYFRELYTIYGAIGLGM